MSDDRDSFKDDKPTTVYQWIIYKRYSNFVDLSEALQSVFKSEQLTEPQLPPKIELNNDSYRNQYLSDRKRQLQSYLRNVLKLLSNRMPTHLLIFLGLHE